MSVILGHPAHYVGDQRLARPQEFVERHRCFCHAFEAPGELRRDVETRRCQYLRHRAVVAEQVDDESFTQVLAYALVGQQVPHVEQIAGVLAVERGDDLAGVKVGEADDLDFRIAEFIFDSR